MTRTGKPCYHGPTAADRKNVVRWKIYKLESAMFNDCKLICSDVDGTLLDSEHKLPARNVEAIRRVVAKEIPFVLASGRIAGSLEHLQREAGFRGPLICLNGAYIIDGQTLIFERTLPPDVARTLVPFARSEGMQVFLYKGTRWFVDEIDEWVAYERRVSTVEGECRSFEELLASWERSGEGFHKLLFMSENPHTVEHCMRLLTDRFSDMLTIYQSSPRYIEILAKDMDKGVGVEKLAEYLGIGLNQVLAIGDFYNDIPMLKAAGRGIAMGNAPEPVREVADYSTDTNDEAGLASALEREILGTEGDLDARRWPQRPYNDPHTRGGNR